MKRLVHHHLILLSRCDRKILQSQRMLKNILCRAALAARATVVEARGYSHMRGAGCFAVIRESHLAIIAFPKYRRALLDIHTCGTKMKPREAVRYIASAFHTKTWKTITLRKVPIN